MNRLDWVQSKNRMFFIFQFPISNNTKMTTNLITILKKLAIFTLLIIPASCIISSFSRPVIFSTNHPIGDTYMGIRLLGMVKLANKEINGILLTELSGLVWDNDEQLLYAVSDNGSLFHLRPIISDNILTQIEAVSAYWLHNKKGKKLQSRDSEGLALLNGNNGVAGDSELVISFEQIPRVARFTPDGQPLADYTLPAALSNIDNYYTANKGLEAVTVHPQLGIITAPEWPLRQKNTVYSLKGQHKHTIYAIESGEHWTFPAYPTPNSAIVALEALADGSVLVLERAFVSVFKSVIISLRRLWLSTCQNCSVTVKWEQVAVFDSQEWRVDNFEGLTHHTGAYFFMVSDDNERSFLQETLLSYWELTNSNE